MTDRSFLENHLKKSSVIWNKTWVFIFCYVWARFQYSFQDATESWLNAESSALQAAFQEATSVSSITSTSIDMVGTTPRITFSFPPEESAISAMNDMNQLLPTWLNTYQTTSGSSSSLCNHKNTFTNSWVLRIFLKNVIGPGHTPNPLTLKL